VYGDFYEITLPALRFVKTEEIEIDKKSENDTEERNNAFQNDTRKTTSRKITTLTISTAKDLSIETPKERHSRNNDASRRENNTQKQERQ